MALYACRLCEFHHVLFSHDGATFNYKENIRLDSLQLFILSHTVVVSRQKHAGQEAVNDTTTRSIGHDINE